MADTPDVERIKKELEKDTRDVSGLWNDALRSYKGIVGVGLVPTYSSVDEMIKAGTEQMNAFHKFRHNDKKVDKLRSLFASNLDYIKIGAQQIVAAATPAFPPAAAIGTALTYMLSACRQVSADYDVVTAFFEDMNSFLQRITILESRLPSYPAYRNCLMDVFTSVLEMCGFATKYIQLRRFKKWILAMIRGEDSELAGARKNMDTRLSRLQAATEYAILGNTEKLQTMSAELKQNEELQTQMLEEQAQMLGIVLEGQENVRNDLKDIRKLLSVFQEQKKEETHTGKQKTAMGKPPTSSRIRSFFYDLIDPVHEYRNLKGSLIPEMSTWIFDEPEWATWLDQSKTETSKLLCVAGPPGSGKSHIAVTAFDRLVQLAEQEPDQDTCVTHFYFRETRDETRCFYFAINWLAVQIAEYSEHLCEKMNVQLSREDLEIDIDDWKDIWKKVIEPLFPRDSPSRLRIVFDGLDELAPDGEQREAGFEFLKTVTQSAHNISVLCTTRSTSSTFTLPKQLDEIGILGITVTKEKQLPDLKTLIWHHLDNNVGLKKLSQYMRQRVSSTLEDKADCLLYAEHILRRFNHLNREPLILRHLEQGMPDNLNEFYNVIMSDLLRRTSLGQRQALKALFMWLAFAVRPITLSEALSVMNMLPGDFDLEEELQGQGLARFLRIADRIEEVDLSFPSSSIELENLQEQGSRQEGASDDWNLPLKFHERSMRDYFRAANVDDDSESLRTTSFEAHRQIFITLSHILLKSAGTGISDKLRAFAASFWLMHLGLVWWYRKLGRPTEEQKVELLEAIGAIFNGEDDVVVNIETAGNYYDSLGTNYLETWIESFADMAKELGHGKLRESTATLFNDISSNSKRTFVNLAKAHIQRWFSATDAKSAQQSYCFVRSALGFTESKSFLQDEDWDEDSAEWLVKSEEILVVSKAFPSIVNENTAYAVALLLFHYGHYDTALPEAKHAIEVASHDPTKKLQATDLLAKIHYQLEEYDKAHNTIAPVLVKIPDVPPVTIRRALVTRAKIEFAQSLVDDAMASYQAARLAQPDTPMLGSDLQDQFAFLTSKLAHDALAIVRVVQSWSPLERLAWMTWKYDAAGVDHQTFQRVCGRAKDTGFMISAYEEVIGLLDAVDAGAPIRLDLAIAQWTVCGNLDAAKELLDEIMDSSSDGQDYRFTGLDTASLLVSAIDVLTDILYEQFRTTPDPKRKAEIVEEMQNIMVRPLARSVSSWRSMANHHRLMLARMIKKTGPKIQYQELLQAAFDVSYEALFDNVGWNDRDNLLSLAMVLSTMGCLEKEARILISAVFSTLDKSLDLDKEAKNGDEDGNKKDPESSGINANTDDHEEDDGEGDTDGEESEDENDDTDAEIDDGEKSDATDAASGESLPADEGDLDGDVYHVCDGECEAVQLRAWQGRNLYFCTICADVALCDTCFQKRQEYNKGASSPIATVGAEYCGANHRYLKGPIEGWQGVKDGEIRLEGEGPVEFKDWLRELKEVKWEEAWETFWLAED
ncbi:hypothetical protein BU23DRAFT_600982 [Bimuria novae-zelandiae CBS 107.79]|uniref:Uncharacterized protein n=1 Tax=Bimuria novae-zelandiae CBS 107.79 TaxID=1447943 RepID=A0A6A5V040_9PLEO|nr:hypothetical protein BU23DRAFT_600982 [Bimuria novae-zelandiae CBS 107.79]